MGGCCERKFILDAVWAAQSEPGQAKDAFEVREELPIGSQHSCEQGRQKMEYYVGLDVSLRSCAMCIVDNKGKVYLERELPCEVEDTAALLSLDGCLLRAGPAGQV